MNNPGHTDHTTKDSIKTEKEKRERALTWATFLTLQKLAADFATADFLLLAAYLAAGTVCSSSSW